MKSLAQYLVLLLLFFSLGHSNEVYTTKNGLEIKGTINKINKDYVHFTLTNGKDYRLHRIKFTPETWKRIQNTQPVARPGEMHADRGWDKVITIENVPYRQTRFNNPYQYESAYFAIKSSRPVQAKALQRLFDTAHLTFKALEEMPLPIIFTSHHDKRFKIEIVDNYSEYIAKTGAIHSAGVYSTTTRTVYVPVETSGLERAPSGYFFGKQPRLSLFVHEITHQITSEELWFTTLPTWVIEGIAQHMEYCFEEEGPVINWKSFSIPQAFRLEAGEKVPLLSVKEFFNETQDTWHSDFKEGDYSKIRQNYQSAFLYFYYFSHLTYYNNGPSSPMQEYLRAVRTGNINPRSKQYFIFADSYAAMENEIETNFLKKEGISVEFIHF